ncbi:hypothetical protein OPV22_014183 [Ensete ventricosum]|uniref:SMP domain-containing protein n=1 Tax=Ensete ventricosum TaxID=4639 RepID=A0AAV8RAY4_ENSVE|nr:hypothetical protein OPV22_014183 [Ensete ventricosum]RZR81366.1 hypothetical protein BHM03_00007578 [Ensete ventricosum]
MFQNQLQVIADAPDVQDTSAAGIVVVAVHDEDDVVTIESDAHAVVSVADAVDVAAATYQDVTAAQTEISAYALDPPQIVDEHGDVGAWVHAPGPKVYHLVHYFTKWLKRCAIRSI